MASPACGRILQKVALPSPACNECGKLRCLFMGAGKSSRGLGTGFPLSLGSLEVFEIDKAGSGCGAHAEK